MERRDYLKWSAAAGVTGVGGYGLYTSTFRDRDDPAAAGPVSAGDDTEANDPEEYDIETRDGWLLLGVSPSTRDVQALDPFESWLGKQHAVVGKFIDMGVPDDEIERIVYSLLETTWQRGHVPHVFWQPFFGSREETSDEVCSEVANGEHDDRIDTWARTLADWVAREDEPDRRLFVNFAPEMNGDWIPWSPAVGNDTEADFVAMWHHVHEAMADAGLRDDHVKWIWTLDNSTRGVDREAVYPGDDYVDWVGIHGYNWTNWGSWETPEEVYHSTFETIRSITDKPLAITEFGCSPEDEDGDPDPGRKEEWIHDAYDYFQAAGVRMTLWFNITKETDWAVFDAEHGADIATVDGTDYEVFPAYRETMDDDAVLGPHPDHPRHVTDEEFAGQF